MHRTALLKATLVLVALGFAACVEDGGYNRPYTSTYSAPPQHYEHHDRTDNLSDKQEKALVDGCKARYAHDRRRFNQCVSGERHSDEALDQGCYMRYRDNPKKLRECLNN